MSESRYRVPLKTRVIRAALRASFRPIFRTLYRVSISGRENIPRRGAYIVVYNHISVVEPPFLLCFWPVPAEAVGAADVWERSGQGLLVSLYGTIPVRRGEFDRQVIGAMLAVLESGRPLMIAPEGGRTHRPGLRRAWPGVGFLIEKVGAPVLPVGVVGSTEEALRLALRGRRPRLEMRIGRPIQLSPQAFVEAGRRASRQHKADFVMAHLAALLPAEYRGVYADQIPVPS